MTNSRTLPAQDQLKEYLDRQPKPTFSNGDHVELRGEYPLFAGYALPAGTALIVVHVKGDWLDCDYAGENVIYDISVPKKKVTFVKHGKPYRR